MRTDTANKLLKSSRSRHPKTVFILLGRQHRNILATILEPHPDCPIPPLADAPSGRWLKDWALRASSSDASGLCEGDLGQARLVREDAAGGVCHVCGLDAHAFARDGRKAAGLADAFTTLEGRARKQFLLYALHMVRQCIVGNYGAASAVRLRASERGFAEKFAAYIHHGNVVDMQADLGKSAARCFGQRLRQNCFSGFEHAHDGTSPSATIDARRRALSSEQARNWFRALMTEREDGMCLMQEGTGRQANGLPIQRQLRQLRLRCDDRVRLARGCPYSRRAARI